MAILLANTPAAMAPWGGSRAVFGTNPLAFACPLPGRAPIVVDLSLSKVARGAIMAARPETGIDLMLEIVRADFGAEITNKVANNFQYERIRTHEDRQRVGREPDLTGKSEKLRRLTELMADNLEEPLSAGVLAQSVELSVRQVERLFLKHLESTPGRYYMTLRLERARQLLRQTNIPILEVALSTGFTSHSYFAQSYRMQFGRAPSDERRKSF